MQDAARIGLAILNIACEMQQITRIQFGIEIQMQLACCAEPGACKTNEWMQTCNQTVC